MTERYLTLMRHGKAAREVEGIEDFDRPLTIRGVTDAVLVAEELEARTPRVDLFLVSSARRARITGEIVAGILGIPSGSILLEERIYMAEPEQLIDRLRELPPELKHVLMVGHNPGIQEAAAHLAGEDIDPLPTSGAVIFRLAVPRWSDLAPERAVMERRLAPKALGR
ncbi:MAG: SixA phosphatase family protein [Spirochaetaceae bacterium]